MVNLIHAHTVLLLTNFVPKQCVAHWQSKCFQLWMMHLRRKLRGSRLPQERWWVPQSHSTWECTRSHTINLVISHFHNKDLLATRTCNCHHLTIRRLIFQLTICIRQVLIMSQIFCRTTLLVDYRALTSVAKDHQLWSLRAPHFLQVKVAPHFDANWLLSFWPADLLPWHTIL